MHKILILIDMPKISISIPKIKNLDSIYPKLKIMVRHTKSFASFATFAPFWLLSETTMLYVFHNGLLLLCKHFHLGGTGGASFATRGAVNGLCRTFRKRPEKFWGGQAKF